MRITNTDANMLRIYIEFLDKFFSIDKNKLRFSILIFGDLSKERALEYWSRELKVKKEQFYKTTIVKVRGNGTYKYKSEYGVVILQLNNIKLKTILCKMIENIH